MANRYSEANAEDVRKTFKEDLFTDARLLDNDLICRNVDEDAVNKCRLSLYGKTRDMVKKQTVKSGDYDMMEKCRATKGDYKLDAREFALEDSFELIYFNYYGHGYNDSPVVDRPGAPYKCPCGRVSMQMNAKTFPEFCPTCGRITPMGELIRDGVMHR